ncbi:hypothetical protein HII13_003426 [Brettanomyces bruxellensis]|uniref:Large ribosomal subunit protein mL53 n=1 Tax=Dekkera bruxellensis TaxID=5007 RepID=A0A7D9H1Y7_DEKBR|nr:uncharacterized protein BRETT_004941 [Brettanomyces bruxellensis]KAF6009350.1 hypothetical protein HII13_003426 [Brettanomyces bruxellensis]KAF6013352.1 hypothetical protein HII12_002068 [Brettanomyces bruxellensis]QOU20287.1 hypothetical protein BRETT_004941 [Brettanomyces bruxellensis]VUG19901.1 MRPL44 [Brettanomyces bruxellensis]
MITKYFTKIIVKFDPFGSEARTARTMLSLIPPKLRSTCDVNLEVLTKSSKNKPLIEVTFKDKTIMKGDPKKMGMDDFTHLFDRHSRALQFKEEISQ